MADVEDRLQQDAYAQTMFKQRSFSYLLSSPGVVNTAFFQPWGHFDELEMKSDHFKVVSLGGSSNFH